MSDVVVAIQTALETVGYLRSEHKKLRDVEIEIQLDVLSRKLALVEHAFADLSNELAAAQRHINEITSNPLSRHEGCFIAGTLVQTLRGPIPIEQVRPGDEVLTQADQGTERTYAKLVNTVANESKAIWVVKMRTFDAHKPKEFQEPLIYNLYAAEFHPFWVEGVGWTALRYLRSGHRLVLADGGHATVEKVWPVLRTPVPGIGWVSTDTVGSYNGLERAHIVDFRNGCNLWHYHWMLAEHCGIPYREGLAWDQVDGLFDGSEFSGIFYSEDASFRARAFNLELEGSHSYFVGELGVLTHSACGANG